jgi:NADP-dependent 3-hydroxy acid dehydrogenase YdfG
VSSGRSAQDLTALVTGASSGIGRAITLALAAQGATVWGVGRKLETLQEVAERAVNEPGSVVCRVCDLADDDQVRELAGAVKSELGRMDVLVHCAGVHTLGTLGTASLGDLDWQYGTNVRAPYHLTQLLLPLLLASRGDVVFVNSSAGIQARATAGQYAATKHALRAIADSFRQEVSGSGVRVLSVYPGRTATPLQESIHRAEGLRYRPEALVQPEDVASVVMAALSLPRTTEMTDVSMRPLSPPERRQ